METLYDLLGALPRDDAEALRAAFRQAVKGAHPDLNPGDPDAGMKFREIVRASEILTDPAQRAAYDHLLGLAEREQEQAQHALAGTVHRLASGVMAMAAASVVGVGAYLLFLNLSAGAARSVPSADLFSRELVSVTATIAEQPPSAPVVTAAIPDAAPADDAAANVGPPLDITPDGARAYWVLGTEAYRYGDLSGALTDFDQAIRLNPKFTPAYVDRATVFYRMHQPRRAFADIAQARRLTKATAPASTKKKPQAASGIAARPAPRRTASLGWQTSPLFRQR